MSLPRPVRALSLALVLVLAWASASTGEWQQPGDIQKPRDVDEEQLRKLQGWKPPPLREIQKPGEIQKAGEIQVPRGIDAIAVKEERCVRRLQIGADALFAFDRADLTPEAEVTLVALVPEIKSAGDHPVHIEGHTDAVGDDAYNQELSEKRATTVKEWLVVHETVSAETRVRGFGEKSPVAPNQNPDGSDDPEGRQKNRRVEIVIDTCG